MSKYFSDIPRKVPDDYDEYKKLVIRLRNLKKELKDTIDKRAHYYTLYLKFNNVEKKLKEKIMELI